MHTAYVGRRSYYSNWPVDHMSDRCTTTDQPTSTGLDRPLLFGRPQLFANPAQTFVGGDDSGFSARTPPEFQSSGSTQMTNGAAVVRTDVKASVSSDESFCSSDDQPATKICNSSSVDGFFAPLPLPSYHSMYPTSVVDADDQSLGPLPTFAGYPFPVLPPASTAGLVPQAPSDYRFGLGTTSRSRLQRQNAIKSSSLTKLASPSRTRSHAGSYFTVFSLVSHYSVTLNFISTHTIFIG